MLVFDDRALSPHARLPQLIARSLLRLAVAAVADIRGAWLKQPTAERGPEGEGRLAISSLQLLNGGSAQGSRPLSVSLWGIAIGAQRFQ